MTTTSRSDGDSAAAMLRAVIITEISQRARTTQELAELAGLEWCDKSRRLVVKAIAALEEEGFVIRNFNPEGSHRGGRYLIFHDPQCGLPRIRCQTPGCITLLARDNILHGQLYCSACQDKRLPARLREILGEEFDPDALEFDLEPLDGAFTGEVARGL